MNKKVVIGLSVGVLLLGGATAYYFLVHKKKKEGTRKKDINADTTATVGEQIKLLCKGESYESNDQIAYTTQQMYEKSSDPNALCEKYSGAEGMVERYSTNLLGAEVFPHSNWMLPVNQSYRMGDGFACDELTNEL
jgi:hypothetical protein